MWVGAAVQVGGVSMSSAGEWCEHEQCRCVSAVQVGVSSAGGVSSVRSLPHPRARPRHGNCMDRPVPQLHAL